MDGERAREWAHTGYAQRIHFAPGAAERLPEVARELGLRRILFVTSEGRLKSDDGERLLSGLGRVVAGVFSGVRPHVPTRAVQAAVTQAGEVDADGIVSFGGGSCADLGKAVCFFAEQRAGAPALSYTDRPLLPHISVPTTYSGAELTPFFGMTDETTRRKTGAGGPTTAPVAAVYDPLVTLRTPSRVSAETAMNALAHGVECAYSPVRTPEAEAVALACVERVASSLPSVVADPDDLPARTALLEGAVLGGRCLHNATMGVHHGLAQLVGGRTGMPHGLANAIVLSHAISFNRDAVPQALARVGAALGRPDDPAGAVDELRARIGLPGRLAECGVGEEDIEAVARLAGSSPSVATNPRPVSEEDARGILRAAW